MNNEELFTSNAHVDDVILKDKKIGDIKGIFYIPKYQRGYRWSNSQVGALINDLWDNCHQDTQKDYCLQPVVIRRMGADRYELIDGQQRFTTILIILLYIKRYVPFLDINYTLEYETRCGTSAFLNNINEADADSNIDFFHIYHANLCIEDWLSKHFDDNTKKSAALFSLMNYLINKVKVIWYEVGENENSIELFTRLNIGRIQLTNAELIKALLLKDYNDENADRDKIERSIQWDDIERTLRSDNDELWYFLTTKDTAYYPTRIELLFDLMSGKGEMEKEKYYTFFWFEEAIKGRGVQRMWEEILQTFLQIKEWYSDNILYHKIGYLISSRSMTMIEIFQASRKLKKSEFLDKLNSLISDSINFKLKEEETYSDLDYEHHYNDISKLLLLFNVESIIQENVYQRFPFSKFNTAEWSLEHIHAQNSQGLQTTAIQIEWLKMHLESIKAVSENGEQSELIKDMEDAIKNGRIPARNSFDTLFNKVCEALSEGGDTEYIHNICNMALLTKNDNAALNNSTFDVKRNLIVEMDQRGSFIPYCTKMVFLKYYTPSLVNQMHFWGHKDRDAYIGAMKRILKPYMDVINKSF